ncbi:unnamed protein product [Caenorhabditis nigoni]
MVSLLARFNSGTTRIRIEHIQRNLNRAGLGNLSIVQAHVLEGQFAINMYQSRTVRAELARRTNLTETQMHGVFYKYKITSSSVLPKGPSHRMASNQPSSSNSGLDSSPEDRLTAYQSKLANYVKVYEKYLSVKQAYEAGTKTGNHSAQPVPARIENQNSDAGSRNTVSGTPAAQPVQAPAQDYFYDKYLTSSVRKQMAKSLNMTEQQLDTFFQNRRSEEKRLLAQFKEGDRDGDSSNANRGGITMREAKDAASESQNAGIENQTSVMDNQDAGTTNQNPESETPSAPQLKAGDLKYLYKLAKHWDLTQQECEAWLQGQGILGDKDSSNSKESEKFSAQQVQALEQMFRRSLYLSHSERKQLAKSVGLTEKQVKTWFHDRRTQERRLHKLSNKGDKDRAITKTAPSAQQTSTEPDPFNLKLGGRCCPLSSWRFSKDGTLQKVDALEDKSTDNSAKDYCRGLGKSLNRYNPIKRRKFYFHQVSAMEQIFAVKQFLTHSEAEGLAKSIGLKEREVKEWFEDRRDDEEDKEDRESDLDCSDWESDSNESWHPKKLSSQQVEAMEQKFAVKQFLMSSERKELAESIGLKERQVKHWFQDRREDEEIKEDSEFRDRTNSRTAHGPTWNFRPTNSDRYDTRNPYNSFMPISGEEIRQQMDALREIYAGTLAKVNRYGTTGPLSSVILSSAEALRQKMDGLEHRAANLLANENSNNSGTSEPLSSFKARKLPERQSGFSKLQVEAMEQKFAVKQFLARYERKQLADSIGLKERQIKEWFQDRREDEEDKEDGESDSDTDYDYDMDEWYPKKISRQQVEAMERKFAGKQFLTHSEREGLAKSIGLKERQIKEWFQDRREDEEDKEDGESDSDTDYDYDMDEWYPKKISRQQVEAMERKFAGKQFLTHSEREGLAKSIGLKERQVKHWFQDRRDDEEVKEDMELDFDSDSDYDDDMDGPMEQYSKKCISKKSVRNRSSQRVFRDRTKDKIDTVPKLRFSPKKSKRSGTSKPLGSSSSGKELRQKLDALEQKFTDNFAKDYSKDSGASEPLSSFKARKVLERQSGFSKLPWESYSRQQVQAMEQKFAVKQFLTSLERKELAKSIGLKERQVKEWCQDRREDEEDKEVREFDSDWDSDSDYDYEMDESMEYCRKKFSCQQVEAMEQQFAVKQFLTRDELEGLAKSIGLKERQVKHWFQERRLDLEDKEDRESDFDWDSDSNYDYDMDDSLEHYSNKFSFRQAEALEKQFAKNKYLTSEVRERLARAINLTETQVETYFIDRRRYDEKRLEMKSNKRDSDPGQGLFNIRKNKRTATVPTWCPRPTKSKRSGTNKPLSSSSSGKELRQKLDALERKFTDSFAKDYLNHSGTSEPLSSFKARKLSERQSGFSKLPWEYSCRPVEAMEQKFAVKQCSTSSERKELAESIGLKEKEVKHWFQDRRDEEEDKEATDDSDLEVDSDYDEPVEMTQKAENKEQDRGSLDSLVALLMVLVSMIVIILALCSGLYNTYNNQVHYSNPVEEDPVWIF